MSNIAIITTTYRAYDKLQKCLSSVLENTKFVDYTHYVMANDPDQKIKDIIHNSIFTDDIRFTYKIEPIYNDTNSGSFSSNNNDLIKDIDSKYVLLLNDDVSTLKENEGWLYSMVRILETDESVGAVGALLLYPDQKTIQHCGVFFSAKTNNMPFHMYYRTPINNVANYISKYRYYQSLTAACLLMRREDYLAIGGLSEEYYYQFEDIDLCLKIKNELKKSCVFCPDACLIHDEGISKNGQQNPKFKQNIETFKRRCEGKFMNDLEFYLSVPDYMVYKRKY